MSSEVLEEIIRNQQLEKTLGACPLRTLALEFSDNVLEFKKKREA